MDKKVEIDTTKYEIMLHIQEIMKLLDKLEPKKG